MDLFASLDGYSGGYAPRDDVLSAVLRMGAPGWLVVRCMHLYICVHACVV
jgi:hypothetical protein